MAVDEKSQESLKNIISAPGVPEASKPHSSPVAVVVVLLQPRPKVTDGSDIATLKPCCYC